MEATGTNNAPRRRRLWRRVVLFGPLLLALALALLYVWATQPARIAAWACSAIERATGATATIDGALFEADGFIRLHGVDIRTPDGLPGGDRLFAADQIVIEHNPWSLLLGELNVSNVRIVRPVLFATEDLDSARFTFQTLKMPRQRTSRERSQKPVNWPDVQVTDAQVVFGEIIGGQYRATRDFTLDARLARRSPSESIYTLSLRQKRGDQPLELLGEFDTAQDTVTAKVNLGRITADDPRVALLPHGARKLFETFKPTGEVSTIKIGFDKNHELAATLEFKDAGLSVPFGKTTLAVTHSVGSVTLKDNDRLTLAVRGKAEGSNYGATYEIEGEIDGLGGDGPMDLRCRVVSELPQKLESPELLPPYVGFLLRSFRPSGRFEVDAHLQRDAAGQAEWVHGSIKLVNAAVRYYEFPYPLEQVNGLIHFDDDSVTIERLTGVGPADEKGQCAKVQIQGDVIGTGRYPGVRLHITAREAPVDNTLYEALDENDRPILDMFFNQQEYARLTADDGAIQSASQKQARAARLADAARRLDELQASGQTNAETTVAMAELLEQTKTLTQQVNRPVFEMGGLASVNVNVEHLPGARRTRTLIDFQAPGLAVLYKEWPYPLIVREGLLKIDVPSRVEVDAVADGLTGGQLIVRGSLSIKATAAATESRQRRADSGPLSPWERAGVRAEFSLDPDTSPDSQHHEVSSPLSPWERAGVRAEFSLDPDTSPDSQHHEVSSPLAPWESVSTHHDIRRLLRCGHPEGVFLQSPESRSALREDLVIQPSTPTGLSMPFIGPCATLTGLEGKNRLVPECAARLRAVEDNAFSIERQALATRAGCVDANAPWERAGVRAEISLDTDPSRCSLSSLSPHPSPLPEGEGTEPCAPSPQPPPPPQAKPNNFLAPDLTIEASRLPIDELLLHSFAKEQANWVRHVGARGLVHASGRVFSTPDGRPDFAIDVKLDNGTACPNGGEYHLDKVCARLTLTMRGVNIESIDGWHGRSQIKVTSEPAENNQRRLVLEGKQMQLGDPLFDLIPPEDPAAERVRTLLSRYDAKGEFDFTLRHAAKTDRGLEYQLELWPRSLRFDLGGERVELDGAQGKVTVRANEVQFDRMKAKFDEGWFQLHGTFAQGGQGGSGEFDLAIDAQANRFSRVVRALLPTAAVKAVDAMKLEGAFELKNARLMRRAATEGSRPSLTFEGAVKMRDAKVQLGVDITELTGDLLMLVTASPGATPGAAPAAGQTTVDMKLDGARLRAADRLIDPLTLRITNADKPGAVSISNLKGTIYGGSITGNGELFTREGDDLFRVDLAIQEASLDPFIKPLDKKAAAPAPAPAPTPAPTPAATDAPPRVAAAGGGDAPPSQVIPKSSAGKSTGTLSASLKVEGSVSDPASRRGGGNLVVRDAIIYETPVGFAMLQLLNFTPPMARAFNSIDAAYVVDGDTIIIDRINFESPTLTLGGSGKMKYATRDLDLTMTIARSRVLDLGAVTDVLKLLRDELVSIRVTGKLDEPKAAVQSLRGVGGTIEDVLGKPKKPK